MPECTCVLIGTTLKERENNLIKCLDSISGHDNGLLARKIISIDDFGSGISKKISNKINAHKFEHIIKKRRGMVKSLREALEMVNTEWVLYSEDDITFRVLPTKEEFNTIEKIELGGRRCGIIGMSCGGYKQSGFSQLNIKNNYIKIADNLYVFIRNEKYRNEYFIDFPSTFMRTELLKNCIDNTIKKKTKSGIEIGISSSWFELGYEKNYIKLSLVLNPFKGKGITIKSYCNSLMPIILSKSKRISGGHKF